MSDENNNGFFSDESVDCSDPDNLNNEVCQPTNTGWTTVIFIVIIVLVIIIAFLFIWYYLWAKRNNCPKRIVIYPQPGAQAQYYGVGTYYGPAAGVAPVANIPISSVHVNQPAQVVSQVLQPPAVIHQVPQYTNTVTVAAQRQEIPAPAQQVPTNKVTVAAQKQTVAYPGQAVPTYETTRTNKIEKSPSPPNIYQIPQQKSVTQYLAEGGTPPLMVLGQNVTTQGKVSTQSFPSPTSPAPQAPPQMRPLQLGQNQGSDATPQIRNFPNYQQVPVQNNVNSSYPPTRTSYERSPRDAQIQRPSLVRLKINNNSSPATPRLVLN